LRFPEILFIAILCLTLFGAPASAQAPQSKDAKVKKASTAREEVDLLAESRRTTAISLVTSLADEARSFRDYKLRARVQARAADALWETEPDRARALFRRAWEAAVAADDEADRKLEEEKARQTKERGAFSIQLPPSMRTEVLRLAAKRDRELGEEFLVEMDAAKKSDGARTQFDSTGDVDRQTSGAPRRNDPTETPAAIAKRLRLAIDLLEGGDVERAIQFADPALGSVSLPGLEFLARLRQKDAKSADQRYLVLLVGSARVPSSDANTASLLSSYIFTPALYVTFSPSGGSNANSWGRNFPTPADIAPQLRATFFNAAASILLRPIPPPDQDRTSSGRAGWYMVIARLLPLFDQFAADKSPALRAQLAQLMPDTPERVRSPGNNALTRGLVPDDPNRDRVQESLNRLNNAKTSDERDAIYVDVVLSAIQQKDPRAGEFINKIENLDLRQRLRAYVDFEAAEQAIRDKDAEAALRLARSMNLDAVQRTWLLTETAKLVTKTEPGRAIELLDEALAEAKRIDASSPDRVRALVAVATQLKELDRPRAWEVLIEIVRAANAAEEFTGEDGRLNSRIQTKNMTISSSRSVQSFDLTDIFSAFAREDLERASTLARDFKAESPRAVATLAVVRAVLEQKREARP
jgi:hypothetical protein